MSNKISINQLSKFLIFFNFFLDKINYLLHIINMQTKFINNCPICGKEMVITRIKCEDCGTEISGSFSLPTLFLNLSEDQIEFIKIFVKCRGNIKEVEKELGISYPTVRNKLNEVIIAMGYKVEEDGVREKILEDLERGEITVDEAVRLLK